MSGRALPRCSAERNGSPKDAHAVKLDTYLQKVGLGERRSASGGPRDRPALFASRKRSGLHPEPRRRHALPGADGERAAARRLRGVPERSAALGSQHLSARSGDRDSGSPSQEGGKASRPQ